MGSMGEKAGGPLADPVAEGVRVATAAGERGLPLRLLGGVAVAVRCPSSGAGPLRREYADVDMAARKRDADRVAELMGELGYAADRELNLLHGRRRLFFWDEANRRQADVFLDEANLCHGIDLRPGIESGSLTLPLSDLLLLKLQVVETGEKDCLDVCAILADHGLDAAGEGVAADRIVALAASDWGLWRTVRMVCERCEAFASSLRGFERGDLVAERLRELRTRLDAAPKSRGWKLRSRIGERKRWYDLPEEVK